jgi:hypothetical protein
MVHERRPVRSKAMRPFAEEGLRNTENKRKQTLHFELMKIIGGQ